MVLVKADVWYEEDDVDKEFPIQRWEETIFNDDDNLQHLADKYNRIYIRVNLNTAVPRGY